MTKHEKEVLSKAESLINKLRSVLLMAKSRGGHMEHYEREILTDAINEYDRASFNLDTKRSGR
jgi:hypothetical protein